MTRDNILYLIIGALVIVTTVLSYQLYQDRKQPEGMRIDLGPNGLSRRSSMLAPRASWIPALAAMSGQRTILCPTPPAPW